jgi:hypothetical protein
MNNPPGSTIEELQQQVRALQTFFLATLAVLVLLSGSLNLFILRQVSIASKQLTENQKFVDDYNKVSAPLISDFLTKLTVASKTNADIGRILAKYNFQQTVAKPGASTMPANPALTPATAPATAPKK